jgi:pre-mRNA-processing factor 40
VSQVAASIGGLSAIAAAMSARGPDQSGDPWSTASAPDGRVYYYNRVTQQTSWTDPRVPAPPAAPAVRAPVGLRVLV